MKERVVEILAGVKSSAEQNSHLLDAVAALRPDRAEAVLKSGGGFWCPFEAFSPGSHGVWPTEDCVAFSKVFSEWAKVVERPRKPLRCAECEEIPGFLNDGDGPCYACGGRSWIDIAPYRVSDLAFTLATLDPDHRVEWSTAKDIIQTMSKARAIREEAVVVAFGDDDEPVVLALDGPVCSAMSKHAGERDHYRWLPWFALEDHMGRGLYVIKGYPWPFSEDGPQLTLYEGRARRISAAAMRRAFLGGAGQ